MNQPVVYLLDASVFIFKAWFGMPDITYDTQGRPLNAVYGYASGLLRFLQTQPVQYMVAAFDESLFQGFRHQLYPDYKSSRGLPDDSLAYQLLLCKQLTEALGITTLASTEFEADDLLASVKALPDIQDQQIPCCILSNDKDLGQLLSHSDDSLFDYSTQRRWGRDDIVEQFQVQPEQLADYLALAGDASDDIPGIPGVGGKTAARLLSMYPDIEALLESPEPLIQTTIRGRERILQWLRDNGELLRVYQQLTRLRYDAPLPVNDLADLQIGPDTNFPNLINSLDCEALETLVKPYGF